MHGINSGYGRCTMDIESASSRIAAVSVHGMGVLLETREVQGMSNDQYVLSAQHGGRTLKAEAMVMEQGSACGASSMERCFRMESECIRQIVFSWSSGLRWRTVHTERAGPGVH